MKHSKRTLFALGLLGLEWTGLSACSEDPPVRATHLDSGGRFACQIAGGALSCWGDDEVASLLPSGEFVDVATGAAHACALTVKGDTICWVLERGSLAPTIEDVPEVELEQIAAGDFYAACGLDASGSLHCWGTGGDTREIAGDLADLEGLRDVDVGFTDLCVVDADGAIRCKDIEGLDRTVVRIDRNYVRVAVGAYRGCGMTQDGEVSCWTLGPYAEFGDPQTKPAGGPFVDIDVGKQFCGVETGGQIRCTRLCIRSNDGTDDCDSGPDPASEDLAAPTGSYTAVTLSAARDEYGCGLTVGGAVVCFGGADPGNVAEIVAGP